MDPRRNGCRFQSGFADTLQVQRLVILSLDYSFAANTLTRRLRLSHHQFGNVIGFLFVLISRLIGRQFFLNNSGDRTMNRNPDKIVS